MVFKVVVVILTLLILHTSSQRLNGYRIDLYNYGFQKHHGKRHDDDIPVKPTLEPCLGDKTCNESLLPLKPIAWSSEEKKRAWNKIDLIDILRSLTQEERPKPMIFVPRYLEDSPEN